MKKYKEVVIVAGDNSETFLNTLSRTINELQEQGYGVEVQYAPTVNQLTALVMSYEEE